VGVYVALAAVGAFVGVLVGMLVGAFVGWSVLVHVAFALPDIGLFQQ
jgi:hypothetical protein